MIRDRDARGVGPELEHSGRPSLKRRAVDPVGVVPLPDPASACSIGRDGESLKARPDLPDTVGGEVSVSGREAPRGPGLIGGVEVPRLLHPDTARAGEPVSLPREKKEREYEPPQVFSTHV